MLATDDSKLVEELWLASDWQPGFLASQPPKMDRHDQLSNKRIEPVPSDVRSPPIYNHHRSVSDHETVRMYSTKSLPAVPPKSSFRSRTTGHGRSCSDSAAQESAIIRQEYSQAHQPARWSLRPRQPSSLQTLKSSPSAIPRPLPKSSSLSSMPQASRQVSHRRSSQKVHQLVGHDLDVMEDVDRRQSTSTNELVLQPGEYPYLGEYWATSSDGSDSEGAHPHSDDGNLPLIEETDETISSRESSWVPRTPAAMPEPLNVWHKRSAESEDSVRGDSGSKRNSVRNFSLHTSSPKRWDPAYGQFTDRKASGAYHKFASELASSLPQQHTQQLQMAMDKGDCESAVAAMDSSPSKANKKSWTPGRLRLSGTAAFARLWDTSSSPETKTGSAAQVRRNTLKKHAPALSNTTTSSPEVAPTTATLRAVSSGGQWPMREQLVVKESPSKMKLREPSSKKKSDGKPCVREPPSCVRESPSKQVHERNVILHEPPLRKLHERQRSIPSLQERTSAKALNEAAPKSMTQRRFLMQFQPIDNPLLDSPIDKTVLRESPMDRLPERRPPMLEDPFKRTLERKHSLPESVSKTTLERKPSVDRKSDKKAEVAATRKPSLTIDTTDAAAASTPNKSPVLRKSASRQNLRSSSVPAPPQAPMPLPKEEETNFGGIPCSAFDTDTEDEDEDDDGSTFRWFSRSVDEDEPEWPRVQWTRRPEPLEKEPRLFSKTSGHMKEFITNARGKALMSSAEKRRSELRKSIKVLRSTEA